MKKSVAVLGLGIFGSRLVDELVDLGADVLIADADKEQVNHYSDKVSYAMSADLSSPEAIKGIGIENMDAVIVSMASCLESSIMCIMIAKELGVPRILAKASSHRMGDIFLKVGADEVIYSEEDSAVSTARKVLSGNVIDYFSFNDDIVIVSVLPPAEWVGKTLKQLNLRAGYGANVIAVKNGDRLNARVDPDARLKKGEELLIASEQEDMNRLLKKLNK